MTAFLALQLAIWSGLAYWFGRFIAEEQMWGWWPASALFAFMVGQVLWAAMLLYAP